MSPTCAVCDSIVSVLKDGSEFMSWLALAGVASAVLIPLALYRQEFNFSVGYGFSVFAMGTKLLLAFQPASNKSLLTMAVTFHGFRLGSFLLLRRVLTTMHANAQPKEFNIMSLIKRPPISMIFGLLYASMVSPVLFALRNPPANDTLASKIALVGGVMAWCGTLLETCADMQKFMVKRKVGNDKNKMFVGPTDLAYRICRHPNYLGEIMLYTGLFVGGCPSFGTSSLMPWIVSGIGLLSILSVMNMATQRLENKQAEAYKGQPKYDTWKTEVKAPLVPFLNS